MFFHRKKRDEENLKLLFKSLFNRIDFLDEFLDEVLRKSADFSSSSSIKLSSNEIASILLFTTESNRRKFCEIMSKDLNSNDSSIINDWTPFVNFFDRILQKFPNKKTKLFGEFDRNVSFENENDEFCFRHFSSWSSIEKLPNENSICCCLETSTGKDISAFTNGENHFLLRPSTKLRLVDRKSSSKIFLREIQKSSRSTKFVRFSIVLLVAVILGQCGNFRRGKIRIEIDERGNRYEGEMFNGKKHGKGEIFYANGYKYSGEWIDDSATGKGIFTWPNGDRYEGTMKNNQRHGFGTYFFVNGDRYVGQWHEDKKHGDGFSILADGKYEGKFENDKMNGFGSFQFSNGDKYVGEWIDDKQDGQGNFTWTDGNRYEGSFKQGKLHGNGTFHFPNGNQFKGQWIDGKQVQDHGSFTWAAKDSPKKSEENPEETSAKE